MEKSRDTIEPKNVVLEVADVGWSGASNQLILTNSGMAVVWSNFYVSLNLDATNNLTVINGGSLIVTNSASGLAEVRRGTLTLNGGVLAANTLLLTNGAQSGLVFKGGRLQTGSTVASNAAAFTVGDGASSAILELTSSGRHSFAGRIGLHLAVRAPFSCGSEGSYQDPRSQSAIRPMSRGARICSFPNAGIRSFLWP